MSFLPNRYGLIWNPRTDTPTEDEVLWFNGAVVYVYRRVDIHNADGTLWKEDVGYIDGAVSIDMSRDERRTLDITLDNTNDDLTVDATDGLWYDKFLKVWRGIVVDNIIHAWKLGEFLIDSINEASESGVIAVTGRDFSKKMMNSKFTDAISFAAGQDIATIIKALGINADIDQQLIPMTGTLTTKPYTFERESTRWAAAKTIANDHGYELFFDQNNFLVLRTYVDPLTSPISLTYDAGIDANGIPDNVIRWNRKVNDGRLYNHVVVIGEATANTVQIFAEAENTEATSPTRIERIGRRTYFYVSKLITEEAQALETANRFLAVMALEQFELEIESMTYPWLDVATVVQVITESVYAPDRYLLTSLSIPLGLASMTANAARVTIITSNESAPPEEPPPPSEGNLLEYNGSQLTFNGNDLSYGGSPGAPANLLAFNGSQLTFDGEDLTYA